MNNEPWVDNLDEAIIKDEQQKAASTSQGNKRVWKKVGFVAVLVTTVCLFAFIWSNMARIPKDKQTDYQGTLFGISTYTDYLEYQPRRISTNLGDWIVEFDLDISDCIVTSFDNYDNYTYISYMTTDKNVFTEIIISDTIPEELNLDKDLVEELSKPNNYAISVTDSDGIAVEKAYKNLYNQGYLMVLQQANSESGAKTFAKDMLDTIDECMLYSRNKDSKHLYVEIDGLGTYDLNQLSVLNGKAGVYFGQDNVLRLYNFDEDNVYGYITNINNPYMMNKQDNLELVDGWNNLYYDKDKDNIEMMGYRGFGVQTSKGFYYIKMDEEAPKELEKEIIELLGIKADDEKIKTIFED